MTILKVLEKGMCIVCFLDKGRARAPYSISVTPDNPLKGYVFM